MTKFLEVQEVLKINEIKNEKGKTINCIVEGVSNEFKKAISQSSDVLIWTFVGNSRSGKSTRLNQLITNNLVSQKPFFAKSGGLPITKDFQFYGPIKFSELEDRIRPKDTKYYRNFNLNLNGRNPDIFLIDCEGTENINGVSKYLYSGMIAISKISSVVIKLDQDLISQKELENIKCFLKTIKTFKDPNFNFVDGIIFMQRDVGPNMDEEPDGEVNPDFFYWDEKRKEGDRKNKNVFLEKCKIEGENILESENFISLLQPDFTVYHPDGKEFYWNSIRDMLMFCKNICLRSDKLDGNIILTIFSNYLEVVLKNDSIEFDWKFFLSDFFKPKFEKAKEESILKIQNKIKEILLKENPTENPNKDKIINDNKFHLIKIFEEESNKQYNHLFDQIPKITTDYLKEMEEKIKEIIEIEIKSWIEENNQIIIEKLNNAKCESQIEIEKEIENILNKTTLVSEKIESINIFNESNQNILKNIFSYKVNLIQSNLIQSFPTISQSYVFQINKFIDDKIQEKFDFWKMKKLKQFN